MSAKKISQVVTVSAVVLSSVAQVLRATGRNEHADAVDSASAALPALTPAIDQLTAAVVAIGTPLIWLFKSPLTK